MKTMRILCALGSLALLAAAAHSEQIVVPLSNPGQPATVEVSLTNGSIQVEAYDGREVVVEVTPHELEAPAEETGTRDGLRRLPNTGVAFEVEEEDNVVQVASESWKRTIDVKIRVPAATSVRLETVNHGNIEVRGVRGEHEIGNVNGWIKVVGVSGSVVAHTTNGDVTVELEAVTAETPMAFSSFNGDVDVTFPANLKADLKMRSNNGDILTDFDVELSAAPPKIERQAKDGSFSYKMESETRGKLNGGGPEMSFRTYNGDIILRKTKS
ncbi:MAG: DUF4097 family beta strand repeat-containing protein [Thermoanaerobaculia bacterium]